MKTKYISLSLVLALALSANGKEELTKEITIEKEFVPTEQKATKTNTLPMVTAVKAPNKQLEFTDWATPVNLVPEIPTMTPYGYKTKYDFSNKKGYLDLGAGSFLNIVGSAGYKIIDKENMKLKAWLQHTSTWAGKNHSLLNTIPDPTFQKQKFNDNVVGVDFTNRFWKGTLDVNAFYHYDHFNYYGGVSEKWSDSQNKQTINEMHLKGAWTSTKPTEGVSYSASLMYNHFGYSHSLVDGFKATKENNFRLDANLQMAFGENSQIGLDINTDYVYYTNPADLLFNDMTWASEDNRGLGVVGLSPYFGYRAGMVNMKLGANLDISINDGTAIRFSPNVKVDFNLIDGFTVYMNAQGGKKLNLMCDMNAINRYINPSYLLGSTYSPLDGEIGVNVGPFSGFSAKLFFGYGIFDNQQLPWLPNTTYDNPANDYVYATTFMRGVDMKGWKAGAQLGYKFRSIATIGAGIKYSPQDENKGYALGMDRPEYIVNAQIKVTPIEKLAIHVDYELRGKRSVYSHYIYNLTPPAIENWTKIELQDASQLSLGASYQITDAIGVFVDANNILNKKWDNYFGMSAQKFNFMGGINFVF